jgi:antitoxin (DNA-binding transcriptional repressor) of toxin-antitoxin stability system
MGGIRMQLSKSQFKPKVLEYLRRVEETGQPILITDHGKPAVEVRKCAAPGADPLQKLRGSVLSFEAPLEPVGEDDWELS